MRSRFRPKVGDTVRDGVGNRYVVKALGMKYAVVHPENNDNLQLLLNYTQMYPADIPVIPNMTGV